ncbi:MAG: transketolase [Nitrospirae bacterium]|nr:transketolase [Nitrospirota bacterium]
MTEKPIVLRDALIEQICIEMGVNDKIVFLSADFGSPRLDKLREDFPERFINVGIAEQNLINIAAGFSLEGFIVYAYAIAPFITMRAYEQIRNNLSLLSHTRDLNVNLIGVGAGLSYDVSGPTHHCLEDLIVMRTLPNIKLFSPSDWITTKKIFEYSLVNNSPKYLRLDGKGLKNIYESPETISIEDGFKEILTGIDICLVSTGYMTHTALDAAKSIGGVGVIDMFGIKPFNERLLLETLSKYSAVITLEEGFINKGGLDSLILNLIEGKRDKISYFTNRGIKDEYVFDIGNRQYLHEINNIDVEGVKNTIIKLRTCSDNLI